MSAFRMSQRSADYINDEGRRIVTRKVPGKSTHRMTCETCGESELLRPLLDSNQLLAWLVPHETCTSPAPRRAK